MKYLQYITEAPYGEAKIEKLFIKASNLSDLEKLKF